MNNDDLQQLLSAIETRHSEAENYLDEKINSQRVEAINYYNGDRNSIKAREGRTTLVSKDVMDTIESSLPDLIEPFIGNEKVGQFEPVITDKDLEFDEIDSMILQSGEMDQETIISGKIAKFEKMAESATKYCDYILKRRNNGFIILYDVIKDALLLKNGFARVYWNTEETITKEQYKDLSKLEKTKILNEDEVINLVEDDDNNICTVTRKIKDSFIKIDSILTEMVKYDPFANSIKESDFFEFEYYKTKGELKELGYDVDFIDNISVSGRDSSSDNVVFSARYNNTDYNDTKTSKRKAEELIKLREVYIKYDLNNDGVTELLKINLVEKDKETKPYILKKKGKYDIEEVNRIQYVNCVAIREPHKITGISLADITRDLQDIKTALQRQMLDAQIIANNPMLYLDSNSEVNPEYLLNSIPGTIVVGRGQNAITPIFNQPITNSSIATIEYFDSVKEERTGITRYNQGLDADSLNKTATGIEKIMSKGDRRQKLVATTIAETFISDIYSQILSLAVENINDSELVKFGNEWERFTPSEWNTKMNFKVRVGIGNADKREELQRLVALKTMQTQDIMTGIVNADNVYNLNKELIESAGISAVEKFYTQPQLNQPITPPAPAMDEASKLKLENDNIALKNQQLKTQAELGKLQFNYDQLYQQTKVKYDQLAQDRKIKEAELGLKISENQQDVKIEESRIGKDIINNLINNVSKQTNK